MRSALLVVMVIASLGCGKKRSPLAEAARAATAHEETSPAIPILNVRALKASQAYFRDVLGFKVEWEHGSPPTFGSVSRGNARLFMCEGCQSSPGVWVMAFVHDVDRLHRELVARKAIIRMPPTDMPWELREMHVADPDGNVIRFASHHDDDHGR
jgi:catechol 2,3-dioxygenase-like lactoylglutathione lyase family enzyme